MRRRRRRLSDAHAREHKGPKKLTNITDFSLLLLSMSADPCLGLRTINGQVMRGRVPRTAAAAAVSFNPLSTRTSDREVWGFSLVLQIPATTPTTNLIHLIRHTVRPSHQQHQHQHQHNFFVHTGKKERKERLEHMNT